MGSARYWPKNGSYEINQLEVHIVVPWILMGIGILMFTFQYLLWLGHQGSRRKNIWKHIEEICDLLLKEILHHLGCIKPLEFLDKLPTSTGAGVLPSTVVVSIAMTLHIFVCTSWSKHELLRQVYNTCQHVDVSITETTRWLQNYIYPSQFMTSTNNGNKKCFLFPSHPCMVCLPT